MIRVLITIKLKEGVEDPEGLTITKTLNVLNFKNVKKTSVYKEYEILMDNEDLETAKKDANEMCKRLLANPVIHDYSIVVERA
jgi:phosphoribosylformylglycinamidine synthase